jgi:hypothetical protein
MGKADQGPVVFRVGGTPMVVRRGYEVFDPRLERFVFVGCLDGPMVEIDTPGADGLLMGVNAALSLAAALLEAGAVPIADRGVHDEEIRQMGLQPVP